jgi:hypothetical protein
MEASARGTGDTVYLFGDVSINYPISTVPSQLFDALRGRGEVKDFTQLDYLVLIDDLLSYIAHTRAVVHLEFLSAIITAKEKLVLDRQKLAASYRGTGHTTKWATDWFFQIPDYSPDLCAYSGMDGRWMKMAFDGRNI